MQTRSEKGSKSECQIKRPKNVKKIILPINLIICPLGNITSPQYSKAQYRGNLLVKQISALILKYNAALWIWRSDPAR